jgi:DNA-binding response OmpR family regulator
MRERAMAKTTAELRFPGNSRRGGVLKHIMLVDDEADIGIVLKAGLERKGFHVDVFNDPSLALSSFLPGQYDLVISDVRMPKMNGLELAYELKKVDPTQRIVFLTAYMDLFSELRKLFERMDILDVIQKPIGITELADRLVALDEKNRSQVA